MENASEAFGRIRVVVTRSILASGGASVSRARRNFRTALGEPSTSPNTPSTLGRLPTRGRLRFASGGCPDIPWRFWLLITEDDADIAFSEWSRPKALADAVQRGRWLPGTDNSGAQPALLDLLGEIPAARFLSLIGQPQLVM
jgi:hypothetical protein